MRILILLLLPFTLFSQVQIPEEKGVIIYHYEDFEDDTTNVGWRTGAIPVGGAWNMLIKWLV